MVLPQVVREAARRFGEQPAFCLAADPTQQLSYRELDHRSDEVANGLAAAGVGPGDVVALALPSCLGHPVAYAAAAKLGAVTAGINPRLTPAERSVLLELVQPRVLLTDDEEVGALRRTGLGPDPLPDDDPARPVAIVFTSGTTGAPRAARFADRQLAAITEVDTGGRWGSGGRSLAATPLSHLGPMTKLPGALMRGGTSYLTPRWSAAEALDLTARHRLETIAGIPTQLALMLAQPDFDPAALTAVRLVLIGGGPATPALVREIRERLGVPVCVRYSCTEAAIGTGTAPDDPPEDAEQTVGRPQPGVELGISGEGEVLLRSAAVMDGYVGMPEATRQVVTADGFVRTGDLGWVDDQGRLHLTGRLTERYVRGGYNVQPVEVEAVIADHPGVRDVAVVALDDDVMGEVGVACVVPTDPAEPPDLPSVRAFAGERLASYKLPDRVVHVEALPLTAADKIDRRALRALAEG